MLPTPTCFCLVAGASEAQQPLTAFDAALLRAGVGDLNLLKVSSILPPGCNYIGTPCEIPPGSLVPIAYGCECSVEPGTRIAASVAVGWSETNRPGVIMEHSMIGSREEAEATVRAKVLEAFRKRGREEPHNVLAIAIEHVVIRTGCVFAGVVLWFEE